MNHEAAKIILSWERAVIIHSDIRYNGPELFKEDRVHMSDAGPDIWLREYEGLG